MNKLTDVNFLKKLFKQYKLRPKEYLGQNFLVDSEVLNEIIEAAQIKKTDTVLEIGPGIGTLTVELVKWAGKVIAVEKDKGFLEILSAQLNSKFEYRSTKQIQNKNDQRSKRFEISALNLDIVSDFGFHASDLNKLQLINQDILKFDLEKAIAGPYKVVANIPYYLTSHLIRYLLERHHHPDSIVLMVQKEVGERLAASPGDFSLLGLSVQIFADVEIVAQVSKNSFWPTPKVDSAIVRIEPKHKHLEIKDEKLFFRIIKVAFAGKRKQIHNTLASGFNLQKEQVFQLLQRSKINPSLRPQDLAINDWIRLYKTFDNFLPRVEN